MGRALITRPGILLLDEPLSALDENLRSQLAIELRRVQRDLNRTFLHVCHSFEEASFVADRIAIMRQGMIEQTGTIQEILAKPSSLFIAEFTRTRNFQEGMAEAFDGGSRIRTASGQTLYSNDRACEGPVIFAIRPEEIILESGENRAGGGNHIKARVAQVRFKPSYLEVDLDAGFPLITYHPWHGDPTLRIQEGDELWLHIRNEAVLVFPKIP